MTDIIVKIGVVLGGRGRVAMLGRLSTRVICLIIWMYQSLVTNKEIATCETFVANLTDKWLLFRVSPDVSLEMFL